MNVVYNKFLNDPINNLDELMNKYINNDKTLTMFEYEQLESLFDLIKKNDVSNSKYRKNLLIVQKYLTKYPTLYYDMKLYECPIRIQKANFPNIEEIKDNIELNIEFIENEPIQNIYYYFDKPGIDMNIFSNIIKNILSKKGISDNECIFLYRYCVKIMCNIKGIPYVKPIFAIIDSNPKIMGRSKENNIFINPKLLTNNYDNIFIKMHIIFHELRHYEQLYDIIENNITDASLSKIFSNIYQNYYESKDNRIYNYSDVETDANIDATRSLNLLNEMLLNFNASKYFKMKKVKNEAFGICSCKSENEIIITDIINIMDDLMLNNKSDNKIIKIFYSDNNDILSINDFILKNIDSYRNYMDIFSKYIIARMEMGYEIILDDNYEIIKNVLDQVLFYIKEKLEYVEKFIQIETCSEENKKIMLMNIDYYKKNIDKITKFINKNNKKIY